MSTKVWHKEEEALLKQWGEMCDAYSWMHGQAQRRTAFLNYACIMVPSLLANTIALSLSFISSNIICDEQRYLITTSLAGVTNIAAIVLTLLESTLRLSDVKGAHRECSALFAKVGRTIRAELSIPKRNRLMDGYDFLRMISTDVDRIIATEALIPQSIVRRFEREGNLTEIVIASTPAEPVDLRSKIVDMRKIIDRLLEREEEKCIESIRMSSDSGDSGSGGSPATDGSPDRHSSDSMAPGWDRSLSPERPS